MGGCISSSQQRLTDARNSSLRDNGHKSSSSTSSSSLRARNPKSAQAVAASQPVASQDGLAIAPPIGRQPQVEGTLPVSVSVPVAETVRVPRAVAEPVPPVGASSGSGRQEVEISLSARILNWLWPPASASASTTGTASGNHTYSGSNSTHTPSPGSGGGEGGRRDGAQSAGGARDGPVGRASTGSSRFSEEAAAAATAAVATAVVAVALATTSASASDAGSPDDAATGSESTGRRGGRSTVTGSYQTGVSMNGNGSSPPRAVGDKEVNASRCKDAVTMGAGSGRISQGETVTAASVGSSSSVMGMKSQAGNESADHDDCRLGEDVADARREGGRDGEREGGGEGKPHGLQRYQRQGSEPLAGLTESTQTSGSSNAGQRGQTVLAMAISTGSQGGGAPSERASTGMALRAMQAAQLRASQPISLRHGVQVFGSGSEWIIFAHAFGDNQQVWMPVINGLDHSAFRIVVYDLTGALGTDYEMFDSQRYGTLHGHVDDLLSIMEHCNQQHRKEATERQSALLKFSFVGHRQAGMIGLLAAARHPEVFRSLVIISSSPRLLDDVGYNGGFTIKDVGKAMGIMEGNSELWRRDCRLVFNVDDLQVERLQVLTRRLFLLRPDVSFSLLKTTFAIDLREILPQIKLPVHIIVAEKDASMPSSVAEYMHSNLKDSRLYKFDVVDVLEDPEGICKCICDSYSS